MKLDHIAIYVDNIENMKKFYEKYFNAKSNNIYYNKKTSLKTYFLTFSDGSRIEIMTRPELKNECKNIFKKGYIHIAFNVGSKENVDKLTKKLEEDGFKIFSNPRITGDGYYESVIFDPENNLIEIVS